MIRFISYMRDTRAELRNTNWLTSQQTISYTALVIGISIFVAAYLAVFDTISLLALEKLI